MVTLKVEGEVYFLVASSISVFTLCCEIDSINQMLNY